MSYKINKNKHLNAYWMPFTPNRAFKEKPRLYKSAKGLYYQTTDGRQVLDAISGLWCSNLGHCHPKITEAIQKQAAKLDYSTAFNFGHEDAFQLADILVDQFPKSLGHVFFTNSGSEAVDTALKIALAYHQVNGEKSRTRLIGRVKGYHGVGFGGVSVGGMSNNRKYFGNLLSDVDHLPFPYNENENAFTRGEPEENPMHYLNELEQIIKTHGAKTIAGVIVEPVIGSAGMFVPPKGYLKKLRQITKKHGILLIFDEVITAFGRLGTANAATYFDVIPDMCTIAKGLNNGAVPMGAVVVSKQIYDCFIDGTKEGVELFHGYTYSAHPLAVASGLASQKIYKEESIYDRVKNNVKYFEDGMHNLMDSPHITDIRNIGLAGGLTIACRDNKVGARAYDLFLKAYELGIGIRANGDTIVIAPILTSSKKELDPIFDILEQALKKIK
ncbi:MAG: aminotransferase class III-fold pyridoxal phosphate-dependent enzyme [Emcibacteraceae bacterium]|jgi:beta-alanine--pyruvate transaminase|nr:aminotransferase class III-fold pyridoxal phosphate-dependent enzyme [Kordiimonadaceae bacterium]MBT6135781.1 aminotransferase class III-fold pyridoxal phosphate-dependent enzyme [Kordiimonadaceae bacterium]MDC0080895.1 aminotransferase class III-fold pyridoxal phosphate-dependent enzyme [Emcibacteraceae bacterium]|tara:strand:- start:9106 stop:10434 length:1329 start_codon:yes stop_codon:yes gene_type:complete